MRKTIFLFLIMLGVGLMPTGAGAQYNVSSTEDVLIAYFKTAGTPPNFNRVARASKDYYLTPVARQDQFLSKETARLQNAYNRYDPATGLLTIRTMVNVNLYAVPQEDGVLHHGMTLSFGKDDTLFFPYTLGDYNIAVLPQKMSARFDQNLSEPQYSLIRGSFSGRDNGRLPLYIQLKPIKAYLDQPYRIGGVEQWALITDVTGLIMTDPKGIRLWTYSAEWYVSPMTQQLRGIYDEQTEDKKLEMETENPILNAR